jgi:hypothetical protein
MISLGAFADPVSPAARRTPAVPAAAPLDGHRLPDATVARALLLDNPCHKALQQAVQLRLDARKLATDQGDISTRAGVRAHACFHDRLNPCVAPPPRRPSGGPSALRRLVASCTSPVAAWARSSMRPLVPRPS